MHPIYPCSLVYLDPAGASSPNSRSKSPLGYVWQALCLNKSLLRAGMPRLNVFTNAADRVAELLAHAPASARPDVHALAATSIDLPKSTPFYAAHFKLDLLSQVSKRLPEDALLMLLDTDMVAMHALDAQVIRRCAALGVGAFDISDQEFPAYGSARVIADLEIVAGRRLVNPRWYGGEFLLATPAFLDALVARGKEYFDRYVAEMPRLNHVGDEAFMSAALNALADEGQPILDVGAYQTVGRHWSGNTHRNLSWYKHCAFVHLPGNKPLVEREAQFAEFDPVRFWRAVSVAHKVGLIRCVVKSLVPRLLHPRPASLERQAAEAPRGHQSQEPSGSAKRL
ncbi:hypothetical protein FAZ95_33190 [Trinickia violacea]|uniref:Glycosyltransferase family 8 protein n=2 Tax=Trinickia violacea TaxID=2571746 RepID=A0A4V1EIU3_9BURK|nr:hypothetical protein FAZ95_33190 [Trinickia violacea]